VRIDYNEAEGYIAIELDDGKRCLISAQVLAQMADPDKRLLFRFVRLKNGVLSAIPYTEQQVIWIDRVEETEAGQIQLGASNAEGTE